MLRMPFGLIRPDAGTIPAVRPQLSDLPLAPQAALATECPVHAIGALVPAALVSAGSRDAVRPATVATI